MIYPRLLARFLAWFGGYFWLPCPLCKQPFAGFECDPGFGAVPVVEEDGEHLYCVCSKPACAAEGQRQRLTYTQIGFVRLPTQ